MRALVKCPIGAGRRFLALSAALWLAVSTAVMGSQGLNVVLVVADDLGAAQFPIYGVKGDPDGQAATPVLDAMATSGGCYIETVWSQPICQPSRVTLMSGRYATLTGRWNNGDVARDRRGRRIALPENSPILLGHLARAGGYATLWVGKTQVSGGAHPNDFGFTFGVFSPGERRAGSSPFPHLRSLDVPTQSHRSSTFWWPSLQVMEGRAFRWVETSPPDFAPDLEVGYIREFAASATAAARPFFALYTTRLGHQWVDYKDPAYTQGWVETPSVTWDPSMETYTRGRVGEVTPKGLKYHVQYLDYVVWRIREDLRELGVLDRTVIIVTSDNPAYAGGKGVVDGETGVRVPFIVYAPGVPRLVQGRQRVIADFADIYPTLAQIFGARVPRDYALSGRSLWPYLTARTRSHREWIYSYLGRRRMIRSNDLVRDGRGRWYRVQREETQPDYRIEELPKNPANWASQEMVAERRKLSATLRAREIERRGARRDLRHAGVARATGP